MNQPGNTSSNSGCAGASPQNKHIALKVRKSPASFAKSVMALGGAAIISQGLGIVSIPIISRLYLPEAAGYAALFASIIAPIQLLATLRYEATIVLPNEDEDAANIFVLCIFNVLLVTAISALATLIGGDYILSRFRDGEYLIRFKWLFPAAIFLAGILQPLRYWNTRKNTFSRLGAMRVVTSVVKAGSLIGGGAVGYTSGGAMIIFKLTSTLASPALLFAGLCRRDLGFIIRNYHPKKVWFWARRYKRFPLIDTWTTLLNSTSLQIGVLFLAYFYGAHETGLYSFCLGVLQLPANLVGAAVSQVVFRKLAATHAAGEDIAPLLEKIFKLLSTIGLLPFCMIVLIGPSLFAVALGPEWVESGIYARMLAPWLLINFIYVPLANIFYVLEKQVEDLVFSVILLSVRAGVLYYGVTHFSDAKLTIMGFGIANLSVYMGVTFYLLRITGVSISRIIIHSLKDLMLVIPILAATALCKYIFNLSGYTLFTVAAILSLPYVYVAVKNTGALRRLKINGNNGINGK